MGGIGCAAAAAQAARTCRQAARACRTFDSRRERFLLLARYQNPSARSRHPRSQGKRVVTEERGTADEHVAAHLSATGVLAL